MGSWPFPSGWLISRAWRSNSNRASRKATTSSLFWHLAISKGVRPPSFCLCNALGRHHTQASQCSEAATCKQNAVEANHHHLVWILHLDCGEAGIEQILLLNVRQEVVHAMHIHHLHPECWYFMGRANTNTWPLQHCNGCRPREMVTFHIGHSFSHTQDLYLLPQVFWRTKNSTDRDSTA